MSDSTKAVLVVLVLCSLPFVGPYLFLMAFLAEGGSEHVNNVGRWLLAGYATIYLVAVYYVLKTLIAKIVQNEINKQK